MDGGIERGKPFIVHHQRLDLGLREFGVVGVGFGVERGLVVLQLLLEPSLPVVHFQPLGEHRGFLTSIYISGEKTPDISQPGGDVGLVDLVEIREGAILAAVLFLQFGQLGADAFQLGD
ncbi:hypothetical protein [Nitrolancea hollandica]|uniref:hypothetical protein n=1 Tax=Nitrolancea hollandica TaxID=1206749 RepID=UPI001266F538